MKFLLALIVILISLECHSQKSNELRTYLGIIDSKLLRNESIDGGASYDNGNTYEFGVKYLRKLTSNLSLETGINYLSAKVEITPSFTGTTVNSRQEDFKLISIPIYANYFFGKYFFLNGGPILDFQHSKESFDSQTGIGYGIGLGGKYDFDKFLIYLNPNFKRHSVIPFEKENNHQKLTEFGIQFGVGYKFKKKLLTTLVINYTPHIYKTESYVMYTTRLG